MRGYRAGLQSNRVVSSVVSSIALAAATCALAPPAARAAETLKVDAAEGGCPRRRDVAAALAARLPGLDRWTISSVTIRRLELTHDATDAVVLRLWDDRGGVALERRLDLQSAGGGRRARDRASCQALAEAAALVTVRYLREIGYRPPSASVPDPSPTPTPAVPEPPAPEPRPLEPPAPAASTPAPQSPLAATTSTSPSTSAPAPAAALRAHPPGTAPAATDHAGYLTVGGGLRLGLANESASGSSGSSGRGEAVISLHIHARLLAASLGAGASSETVVPVAGGAPAELRLRAFPLRLGAAVPLPLAWGVLLPTLAFSADLLSFRAVGLTDARSGVRFDPAGELGLAYAVLGRGLFVRVSGMGGLTLAPRDFETGSATTYRTPAAYFRGQLEVGFSLWKNSSAPRL